MSILLLTGLTLFCYIGIITKFFEIRKCVYAFAHNILSFGWGEIFMHIKKAVVIRFQQLCAANNIKNNELATRSGVTPSTVYSLMDDRRLDVSILTIKKLCDGLDISIREFFVDDIFCDLEQEIK